MRRRSILISFGVITFLIAAYPATGNPGRASTEFDRIVRLMKDNRSDEARTLSFRFLKSFPKSHTVPDVKLILADTERSPDRALTRYREVIDTYRSYPRRDYALFRMCEIHHLLARWRNLESAAEEGCAIKGTPHYDEFAIFLVIALMQSGRYARAEQECRRLIERNHDYETLARSLLLLAQINRRATGFSRDYIATIRQISLGYTKSEALPATLFLLGEFYEYRKMHDEAYSAYTDLLTRFPDSPEAAEASKRMPAVIRHNPHRVSYIPGTTIVDATEPLDIHPEMEIPEDHASSPFYSISIGPFDNAADARDIRRVLRSFDFLQTIRLRRGYAIYAGRASDEESALKLKIRLAEEFGINGRIIRISGNGRQSYIYGE